MNFCPECSFLLYPTEIEGKLMNSCKNCKYKEINNNRIIVTHQYKKQIFQDTRSKRKYIHDSTLERTSKMTCPNTGCASNTDSSIRDAVIFIEPNRLVKIFICAVCGTEWNLA